ncbi:phosphatase, partial [Klebsiella pneumoniae]
QPLDEPGRPAAHKEYQNARAVMEGQFPGEHRRWRKLLDDFFTCIRDNDQHLEAVLNELDNLQLTQNTSRVLTADRGELGGSHQMPGKGCSVCKGRIYLPRILLQPAYPGN